MVKFSFPELRQFFYYDCGAVAIQGVLAYYGFDVEEEEIMKIAKTNNKTGTSPNGLKKVAEKFRLKYSDGKMSISDLKKNIRKKIPVIILIEDIWSAKNLKNYDENKDFGHYVVPIGFDKERIFFEDPWSCFRTYLTFNELDKKWKALMLKGKKWKKIEHYGIKFYGRKPVYKENEVAHMGLNILDKHAPVKRARF